MPLFIFFLKPLRSNVASGLLLSAPPYAHAVGVLEGKPVPSFRHSPFQLGVAITLPAALEAEH